VISENSDDDFARPDTLSDDDMPLDLALDDNPDLRLRLGRYLGGVRKLRKISQETAAKALGLSRPHLSNIEMGRSRTGWQSLRTMAKYYGYGIRALIEEVDAAMPPGSVADPDLWPAGARGAAEVYGTSSSSAGQVSRAGFQPPLTEHEGFILGLLRTLDEHDQRAIAAHIMERVEARMKRFSGS